MLRFFETTIFRALAVTAALLAVYALAGFVIAPKLLRSALLKDIPASLGVTPSVGKIHINPFLLQVSVDKFSLTSRAGAKLVGFERLFIDFELSSIWHRAYSFGNIDITAPFVNAAVAKDGTLNLLQLRPRAESQPDEASKPLPAIRIGSLKLSHGSVTYEDRSRPDAFTARLEPLNFELRDFSTGAQGGKFRFAAASKQGERIEWHGHLAVQPIESDGEFRIDGLRLHTLWEYLEDRVNFEVNSGTVDLGVTYKFSAGNASPGRAATGRSSPATRANLELDLANAVLTDLAMRPKDSEVDWVTLPKLRVTGTHVDLAERRVRVDLVAVTGLKLLTWLEPDGSINLMRLAAAPPLPGRSAPAPPGAAVSTPLVVAQVAATGVAAPDASPPWQFDLRRLEVQGASLAAEDRGMQPAVKVLLAPLSLKVDGVSQDLSKPVTVSVDTRVNATGSVQVEGSATPQPASADLSVKLAGLELPWVQPYVAEHSALSILAGKLGGGLKIHYGARVGPPSVEVAGSLDVEGLHTIDNDLRDDFINWDRLDVLGLRFTQSPSHLDIDRVVLRNPYARVIIEADASLNVKRVLTVPAAVHAGAAAPHTASAQTMSIAINKVLFESGQANFTDLSLVPNFSAGIAQLAGTMTGLSSAPNSRATVDLNGSVDRFSPVSVKGLFNVLGPKLYTDIAIGFHNISLPILDPYSGKFAGYNISEGKLDTDFHYKVDGRKLDAEHHIVINRLEFGAKTDSKEAVSLPIKLAVALLKDRNGVIDLNFPVTGSLDDPQFRLAPVIWKVFVDVLEKAVTAPFALLGSLFGAGPDLQFIDFPPGVGTLDASAVAKARVVAKALTERPTLKIEVPIAVIPELDRPALADARFKAEIDAAVSAGTIGKKTAPAVAAFDQLDAAARLDLLGKLYTRDLGEPPIYPDAVGGSKSKTDVTAAKLDFLGKAIHAHIQIGAEDLQTLGRQRAQALQEALLADSQVSPERVFLVANDKATANDGTVRLELSLE